MNKAYIVKVLFNIPAICYLLITFSKKSEEREKMIVVVVVVVVVLIQIKVMVVDEDYFPRNISIHYQAYI